MDFSSFDLQTGLTVEVVVSVNLSRKLVDAIYTKRPDFLDSEGARDWDKVTELFYKAFREHNFDSTGAVQLGTEFYLECFDDTTKHSDAKKFFIRIRRMLKNGASMATLRKEEGYASRLYDSRHGNEK